MKKIMQFLQQYIDDVLIFLGLTFMIYTTFLISKIAGLYTLGAVLFLLGVFFAITSSRKGG